MLKLPIRQFIDMPARNHSKILQTQAIDEEVCSLLAKWPENVKKSIYERGGPLNRQYSLSITWKLRKSSAYSA